MTEARGSGVQADVFHVGEPDAVATSVAVEPFHIGQPDALATSVAVEPFHIGQPRHIVSRVAVDVFRSIRDAPFPVFPVRLFGPPSFSARLPDGSVRGPMPLAGDPSFESLAAGGRWALDFAETPLPRREQMLTWRALAAAADWGATSIIVPLWDRKHQVFGPTAYTGASSFGLELWHDALHWAPDQVEAELAVTADRGATIVTFAYDGPEPACAGVHFSILGRHWGWRLYRIVRVIAELGDEITAEIRPPLREWAKAGELLNFDSPRCTMRSDGPLEPQLEQLRLGHGAVRFVETFARTP